MKKLILTLMMVLIAVPVGAERFYDTLNRWYYPIPGQVGTPGSPTVHAKSTTWIDDITNNHTGGLVASPRQVPIFYTVGGEDIVTVGISESLDSATRAHILANDWNDVPIPDLAVAASPTSSCGYYDASGRTAVQTIDGYMVVVDEASNSAWHFHTAGHCVGLSAGVGDCVEGGIQGCGWAGGEANPEDPSSGRWDAYFIRKTDLTGDGIHLDGVATQSFPYGQCSWPSATPKAGCADHLNGIVTYDEIVAGTINHALVYGMSASGPGNGLYPASAGYSAGVSACAYGGARYNNCALLGARFQLKPDVWTDAVIAASGMNYAAKIIATAMRDYGMIFVINNAANYQGYDLESFGNYPSAEYTISPAYPALRHPSGKAWTDAAVGSAVSDLYSYISMNTTNFQVIEPLYSSEVDVLAPKDISDLAVQ